MSTRRVTADHVTRQVRRAHDVVEACAGLRAIDRADAVDAGSVGAAEAAQVGRVRRRLGRVVRDGSRIHTHGITVLRATRDVGGRAEPLCQTHLVAGAVVCGLAADRAVAEARLVAAREDDVGKHPTSYREAAKHAGDTGAVTMPACGDGAASAEWSIPSARDTTCVRSAGDPAAGEHTITGVHHRRLAGSSDGRLAQPYACDVSLDDDLGRDRRAAMPNLYARVE